MQSGTDPVLGDETTGESEGEVSHYSARRREILDNAATVFADASDEYGSLPTLKKQLEAWKATQGGECLERSPKGVEAIERDILIADCFCMPSDQQLPRFPTQARAMYLAVAVALSGRMASPRKSCSCAVLSLGAK